MDVIELARSLIRVPSISVEAGVTPPPLHGEAALVALLQEWLTARGAVVDVTEVTPGRPNLVACFGNASSGPSLLMEAHSDTVAVDGMTIAPFDPEIRNGRLYGRGASDVKGPMAAMLMGIIRYLDAHGTPPGPLHFAAAYGEELGGLGAAALIKSHAVCPDAVIVAEPTDLNVVYRHKGIVRYRITTQGRAVHSSQPAQGINAIVRMQPILKHLVRCGESFASQPGDPKLGQATLSIGTIRGGSQVNIVPDHCSIEVDHRLLPGESLEDAIQHMRTAVIEAQGHSDEAPVSFEVTQAYPPLGMGPDDPLVHTVLNAVHGVVPQALASVAHYGTDAGFFHAAGIPAVVVGPGSINEAHTVDESISVDALSQGASVYTRIIENFFGTPA